MSEEKSTPPELTALIQANNHLAVHLHLLLSEENRNVFFSPFSISTAMAMVLYAAKEETEVELRKALGYEASSITEEGIVSAFEQYLSHLLKGNSSYTLSCANSVLIESNFEVKDSYKMVLKESFKALLQEVNFKYETENVVTQINDWVNDKTNGMIPKLIQSLDPDTVIVLLNAVYFKGLWHQKFDKKQTSQLHFYNHGEEEKAKTVDMMYQREFFPFAEKDTFQALQLPYCGNTIAMLIVLPKNKTDLKLLEETISSSLVQSIEEELRPKKVIVKIPRFKLRYSKSLVECFQRLGIERLFQTGAQLDRASDSPNLAVTSVIHEAILDVNEEGSEAVSVTKMGITKRKMSLKYDPEFIVDHPFLFVIYDKINKLILFMGRVVEL